MSEEAASAEEAAPAEEPVQVAPGLALAQSPPEQSEDGPRRRRGPDPLAALRIWVPRTRLGRMVMSGDILTYEQALASGLPIREVEIVDALLPGLEDDVLSVNMIQRMTDSGRRVRFNVLCAVGNGDGYVGLSICKGKEVASTIQKAIAQAKLNVIPVMRGNGSWESSEGPGDSIPFKTTGRSGSTRVTLLPAPAGKGLVIGDYGRRVLALAGVSDVWSRSSGQTRSTINFAKATFNALIELSRTKVSDDVRGRLQITTGRKLA
ncbi:MAG: 30S ribosomal protein S5 [Candidatus Thalassarchaeaceae archaeon]|nr:30S ribosomal protein S5 [Candidatus Thalassarchaeaceae archaeon]MDP7091700.1 30S ribosomal protein S5 [Candidatus Thalassarchaeaceae archaeon]MDP7256921.1 30S ribosomal protein S5 [Candidatus Thalassarchaeaceae archaeon]MDP7446673.1 30S ribosomal protein S5 [Candidatus Thalassarchaeaceae archaeon]MDP7649202.1 30S ribosomal protein S5 [Candidatus Thalassarchaeaceae archaeon]